MLCVYTVIEVGGLWDFGRRAVGGWANDVLRRANRGVDVLHVGCDVLHHPARAVVPPPRLRAKWVVFSAPLRTTPGGSGWALTRRCGKVESLRNPAPRGVFLRKVWTRCCAGRGGDFKKSNFSNHVWEMGWRPRIPWGSILQKGVTEK